MVALVDAAATLEDDVKTLASVPTANKPPRQGNCNGWVPRIFALVLLACRVAPVAAVSAFDCTTYPNPLQIVKASGYKLKQLDISTGVYSDVHTVQLDTAVDSGGANPGEGASPAAFQGRLSSFSG